MRRYSALPGFLQRFNGNRPLTYGIHSTSLPRRVLTHLMATALALTLLPMSGFAQEQAIIKGALTNSKTLGPLSGATIMVAETKMTATTDSNGAYQLRIPAGAYTILAFKTGFETRSAQITVSPQETLDLDFQLTEALPQLGEEMVVLGSRSARTAVETPVPVDVLAGDEIAQTGMSETSRIIQFLAPSFNFSTSTISDGTDIVRPSTLRGLGPDQTLVLINGKRRHNSALVHVNGSVGRGTAGVDLNSIPAEAIERIEILRDGAAAQYGSDAIAGVINIVLKSNTEKTMVNFSAGQTYDADGEVFQIGINRGFKIGENGFFNVTAEYRDRGFTNRAGADPRPQYLSLPNGSPDPREATFNRINHRYGDAESQDFSLFFNSSIPVTEDSSLYFFGGLSQRNGESAGFYRRANDSRNVPAIHPDGFLPLINTNVDDYSVAGGFRKSFSNWALDASVTLGKNSFEFVIEDSVNVSLGTASPTSARAGTLYFRQATFNLDLFTSLDWGLPRRANLAFGAEFRRDNFEIEAGEDASFIDGGVPDQFGGRAAPGIQVFPGFRLSNQVDESRNNLGLYADLETGLTSKLLVGIAGRFEHYSDFGSNASGKVVARYAFSDRFAARGSISSGFRAPSLHQAFFNNTSTQFVFSQSTGDLVPFEVGTFRNDGPVTRSLGVPELREETSVNYSVGFTAKPVNNLLFTADFFKIDIEDRIVISGLFQAEFDASGNPAPGPVRNALQPFGVNAAQFFTNAIDTETEGIDVVLAYRYPLTLRSALSFTAAANWNRTDVVGQVRTPPQLQGLGETLFDRIERERIEYAQPRQLYNLAGKYQYSGFAALVRLNKFGNVKTVESASDPSIDQVFRGKWITDFDLSYKFESGLIFALGANNLFDIFPDENRSEISFNGIFIHPRRTAPFGFNGGYYYTRLSYEF